MSPALLDDLWQLSLQRRAELDSERCCVHRDWVYVHADPLESRQHDIGVIVRMILVENQKRFTHQMATTSKIQSIRQRILDMSLHCRVFSSGHSTETSIIGPDDASAVFQIDELAQPVPGPATDAIQLADCAERSDSTQYVEHHRSFFPSIHLVESSQRPSRSTSIRARHETSRAFVEQ